MPPKCLNCSHEIELQWNVCPNCGEPIPKPTPEQARRALQVLESLTSKTSSRVSHDPTQLREAMRYVDAVTELTTQFGKVFKAFLDHHEKLKRKPSTVSDPKWAMTAKVLLLAVFTSSYGSTDPDHTLQKQFPTLPDGCFPVHFEVSKLQQHSEELADHYGAFIQTHRQSELEASGQAVTELSNRLTKAIDAVGVLIREIQGAAC